MHISLNNFYDFFINEIKALILQNSKNGIKHNNKFDINGTETNTYAQVNIHNTSNDNNINEIVDNKNNNFIILFSVIGKELLLDSNIVQKNDQLISNLIITFGNGYFLVLNKHKFMYSAVMINNKVNNHNKLLYVYSLYEYCDKTFFNDIQFYVEANFIEKSYAIFKIEVLNLSNEIWNYTFSKTNIKNKLIDLHKAQSLCFILCYDLLTVEYKICILDIIKKLNRRKKGDQSIFFIVKKKNDLDNYVKDEVNDSVKCKENNAHKVDNTYINENKKSISHSYNKHKHNTSFYNKLFSLFNLLRQVNVPLLNVYNLESYTRVFIYKCESLNRNNFIKFLANFENFHFHLINLNTLFGLYFSETEKNILSVFKKCQQILKKTQKNVCLVIDGIDILAKNAPKGCIEKRDHTGNYSDRNLDNNCADTNVNGLNNYNNGNNRYRNDDDDDNNEDDDNDNDNNSNQGLLTTLLLCLDSIDNHTIKKTNAHKMKLYKKEKPIKERKAEEKNNLSKNKFLSFLSDKISSDESTFSTANSLNNNKKSKNVSEQITYDIKKLKKNYKKKHIQYIKKKITNHLSIIVLSDLNLNCFDVSLTRAGRFFHYIKYS